MCLSAINDMEPASTGEGYKVFTRWNGRCRDAYAEWPYYPLNDYKAVEFGRNLIAQHRVVVIDAYNWYRSGFHIFKTLAGARRFVRMTGYLKGTVICRVSYSKARLSGTQDRLAVVVADEMIVRRPVCADQPNRETQYVSEQYI